MSSDVFSPIAPLTANGETEVRISGSGGDDQRDINVLYAWGSFGTASLALAAAPQGDPTQRFPLRDVLGAAITLTAQGYFRFQGKWARLYAVVTGATTGTSIRLEVR